MAEIDLMNRDPQNVNHFLQVDFEDVLAEPKAPQTIDCVWKNSAKCFKCGKSLCYKILTILTGIFIALWWGCVFGYVSFCIVWIDTPAIRLLHVVLFPLRKIISIILSTFVGPCVQTLALFFSRIHVTQSQGEPPKPIDDIIGGNSGKDKNFK